MQQSHPAQEFILARRSLSSMAIAMAFAFTVACEDNDDVRAYSSSAGAGEGGAGAVQGGASGAAFAGSPSSSAGNGGSGGGVVDGGSGEVAGSAAVAGNAGSSGVAGNAGSSGVAGSAGSGGVVAGIAGSAGSGGSLPTTNCASGGDLFVVGNYADPAGNRLMLRAAPKAATFALVPAGAANAARPPQLFLVERLCAPSGALIASDGSSNHRVDFVQSGNQFTICLSVPVSRLEAALALPPADTSHSTSTGCMGHPFTIYSAEVL